VKKQKVPKILKKIPEKVAIVKVIGLHIIIHVFEKNDSPDLQIKSLFPSNGE
jgi:hypothetical protein